MTQATLPLTQSIHSKSQSITGKSRFFLLGLGREGWSSYQYLRSLNPEAEFVLSDDVDEEKLADNWQSELKKSTISYLPVNQVVKTIERGLLMSDQLVLSPGIPLFHPFCQIIEQTKIRPTSNTELFLQAILDQPTPPLLIGVTGTKGKSTTASLIHHVLKSSLESSNPEIPRDHHAWKTLKQVQGDSYQASVDLDKNSKHTYHLLAGNIGTPPLEILPELERVSQDFTQSGTVTLELSSHQLRLLNQSPHIAVIQNISQEHLDHFGNFETYVEAKSHIVRFQTKDDLVVFNQDLKMPAQLADLSPAKKMTFMTRDFNNDASTDLVPTNTNRSKVKVETANPNRILKQVQDDAVYNGSVQDDALYNGSVQHDYVYDGLVKDDGQNQTTPVAWIADNTIICDQQSVLSVDQLPLLGKHNWQNVMPAVVIAHHLGLSHEIIAQAIKSFQPLKHRLQKAAEINGVLFVNDTLATGPAAAAAALKSFPDRPIIALVGGYDRGLDLTEHVEQLLATNLRALILFPTTGERLEKQLKEMSTKNQQSIDFPIHHVTSMAEAMIIAKKIAQTGDVVLLSPGAASFGLFKDYADRGEQFIRQVNL